MAAADRAFRPRDDALIALLRRLRDGADVRYVHRADVCSAAPADLVANLEPALGTDRTDDGYSSVWYFYCAKRYKSARGKPGGHRQRAIGAGETCWHSETGPKNVEGTDGGTSCNLSYGRKEPGPGRRFHRMGWCMTEYDVVDKQAAAAGRDCVLCKVYRSSSSLAKGRSSSSCSSESASSKTAQPSSGSKRKAAGDHPEARPAKMSHEQVQEAPFTDDDPMSDEEVDYESLFAPLVAKDEQGVKPPRADLEQGGEYVETAYGTLPRNVADVPIHELLGGQDPMFGDEQEQGVQPPLAETADGPVPCVVADDTMDELVWRWFDAEFSEEPVVQQPREQPVQGGDFVQIPLYGPLAPTVDEMLDPEKCGVCMPAETAPVDAAFFEDLPFLCCKILSPSVA